MDFNFYQWVQFQDKGSALPGDLQLERWLGVAHKVGSPMCYYVLCDRGSVLCRFTVQPLLDEEAKCTAAGWDLEVEWKDGSTSWLPLRELKETNTVEVAEYAERNGIMEEPAFDWWAKDVIRRRSV